MTVKNSILIIDDEPALLSALVDKFTRAGFLVTSAVNGKAGLQAALQYKPDMILLDIIMPVMDGITMLAKLRKDPWGRQVKVILLTNLSDPGIIAESVTKTVSGYLVKSDWKLEDLVKQVTRKLAD
jgi:CheY-like chemotaxis protein